MTTEEIRKTIEGMVPYGAKPYPLEAEREFRSNGPGCHYSDRLHVEVNTNGADTSFAKYSPVPGSTMEDGLSMPTADIKAIRYGFGCTFAIERNNGEIVLFG